MDEKLLKFKFFAASAGPGGQHVNKVATACELRFDVDGAGLNEEVRERLVKLAGRKMTLEGEIVIVAKGSRSQEANKVEALARLEELLAKARKVPVKRKKSRPTKASRERRLEGKKVRSGIKRLRGKLAE
jgi:ribosome-associated protein